MFGEGAVRLAGLAGALFGWSADTFWAATPAELAAVVRAAAGDGAGEEAMPPDADMMARLREAFPDG